MRSKLLSLFAASLLLAATASAIAGPAPDTPTPELSLASGEFSKDAAIGNIMLSTSNAEDASGTPTAVVGVVDQNYFSSHSTGSTIAVVGIGTSGSTRDTPATFGQDLVFSFSSLTISGGAGTGTAKLDATVAHMGVGFPGQVNYELQRTIADMSILLGDVTVSIDQVPATYAAAA